MGPHVSLRAAPRRPALAPIRQKIQQQARGQEHGGTLHSHSSQAGLVPRKPANICQDCWRGPCAAQFGIDRRPVENRSAGGYRYTILWEALKSGACSGCVWCQYLVGPLGVGAVAEWEPNDRLRIDIRCLSLVEPILSVDVNGILRPESKHDVVYMRAGTPTESVNPWGPLALLQDVRSSSMLTTAKKYLEECLYAESEHEHCHTQEAPSVPAACPPSRLIDCTRFGRLRLVDTHETKRAGWVYLALSYVWGPASERHYHTTTTNLDAYIRYGIDTTTIPQTIRDTVSITRALGFHYLWIDALCIVQDSPEDVHIQMARMLQTYQQAYLTIIAASASSAAEGFLQDRPIGNSLIPVPVVCPPEDRARSSGCCVGTIYVRQHLLDCQEPIDKRAWCLQELWMSPRSLIFTSTALVYQCRSTSIAIGGLYQDRQARKASRLPAVLLARTHSDPRPGSGNSMRWAWWDVVQEYSRRSLSCPSDKLVACAGLAEKSHQAIGSDYLAGLWRETLVQDLLWKPAGVASRPDQYRAPSWSWASLEGAIIRPPTEAEESRLVARQVECDVILADERIPFGQVTGGRLVLQVPLIRSTTTLGRAGERLLLMQTAEQAERCRERGGDCVEEAVGDPAYAAWAHFDTEDDAKLEQIWAAPIRVRCHSWQTRGVIVALDKSSQGGTRSSGEVVYRRIGYFDGLTSGGEGGLGWDEQFSEAITTIALV